MLKFKSIKWGIQFGYRLDFGSVFLVFGISVYKK